MTKLTDEQRMLIRLEADKLKTLYKKTDNNIEKAALNGRMQGMYEVIILLNNIKKNEN